MYTSLRQQWLGDSASLSRYTNTYETIFKNGLSLFDDGFELHVRRTEVDDLIQWLKGKGSPYSEGLWPDGRRLTEVIIGDA